MTVTETYAVTGMTCDHCVQAVTGEVVLRMAAHLHRRTGMRWPSY